MSEPGTVVTRVHSSIAEISFAHPKANSLSLRLLDSLRSEIEKAGSNQKTKIILLHSEGDGAFCAGASFEEFNRIQTLEEAKEFFAGFASLMLAMKDSRSIIISCAQGKVVGGGLGLLACSDYVFASKKASFKLSELDLDIAPATIGIALERKIGIAALSEMTLDRQWRDARTGQSIGLYSKLSESVVPDAREFALELDSKSVKCLEQNRELLWSGTQHWHEEMAKRVEVVANLLMNKKHD